MFMDVSGSCSDYFKDFEKAASIIKSDPIFQLNCYAFDTRVTKLNSGDTLKIGGGTSFYVMEQELMLLSKYPDVVIVIPSYASTAALPSRHMTGTLPSRQ